MVAYNPSERPTIEQILNSLWLKEINNLNQNEELELEKEVKKELDKIFGDIKDLHNEIKIAEKIKSKGYNTRGGDESIKFFNDDSNSKFVPKNIPNDRINLNHYLILNGNISGIDFMNSLANKIYDKYQTNCFIEPSKESLKFEVCFDSNNNNDDDDSNDENDNPSMVVELFKYENGKYLLEFMRTRGEIKDYYHNFLKIKEIIIKDY